jgi:hypothetical protein
MTDCEALEGDSGAAVSLAGWLKDLPGRDRPCACAARHEAAKAIRTMINGREARDRTDGAPFKAKSLSPGRARRLSPLVNRASGHFSNSQQPGRTS